MAASASAITIPDDLLQRASPVAASEGRSLDELAEAAIETYLTHRENFDNMLAWGRDYGRQIGIASDEDVERIANGEISLADLRRPS